MRWLKSSKPSISRTPGHRLAAIRSENAPTPYEGEHAAKCSCGEVFVGNSYRDVLIQWQIHAWGFRRKLPRRLRRILT